MADNDWQSQAIPVLSPTGGDDSGFGLSQYKDTFTQAEERYGLPKNLLTAISMQENVAPHHNNPLGLSTDAGVKTFSTPEEANDAIMRQAALITNPNGPYAKFARTRNIDDLAAVYSPVGASNDIYGTNATEASGIRANLQKLGSDWRSEAIPVQPQEQDWRDQAVRVEQPKVSDWQGQAKLATNHPIAQQNGWTLAQTIQNIWDGTKVHLMGNALATAKQRVEQNVPDQLVQQQIDNIKASPYLTDEQKQQNIASIQQGQQRELEDAKSSIPRIQSEIAQSEESIKKNNTGPIATPIEKVVSGVLPYLSSGLMGPLGPIQAAQQASAETYGDVLDSSAKRLKELHPDWNDGKVVTQAVKAASEASTGSGEAMLALSVVDVPAAGGIISRIAQKIGIGAATMEVANSFAEVQKNMAIKKDVDPKEDWLGQLRNIEFHVQNLATGGTFGGLHGLGEIGRPSHVPIEDRVPIAEVPETKEEPKVEESPEKVTQAAVRYKGQVETGNIHADAVEKLLEKTGKVDQDDFYQNAEHGYVTDKGRFITRQEADELTGRGIDSLTVVDPVQQPPVTGTDPWLSSIANRYTEERQASGEIGQVTPGKGTTSEAVMARGTAMGPEQIAQHVSDLMQGKGSVDQVAALRAEEARLSQESWRLSRIAEANPDDPVAQRNAEDAHRYVTDFHNGPIKKLKENWAQTGHGLQKEIEVDLGSFNGLREQWLRDVGKEPDKNVQQKMRDTARKVREAQASEKIAMETLGKEIDRQTTRRKLPTPEEVRARIMERVKDFPCVT